MTKILFEVTSMYLYNAYGLIISSELKLNGLIEIFDVNPQIIIKYGNVPDAIDNPIVNNPRQQINQKEYRFDVKDIAIFYVYAGREIIIQKAPNGHEGDIQVFLMGTVFAYILQYHEYLVLHGSAVLINNHAVIFSGESGAGKSTIAAAFAKKNHTVLTDDMVAIKYTDKAEIIPGWPRLKLWQDALDHFGEEASGLIPVQNKIEKYEYPINNINLQACPISHFYELNPSDIDTISLTPVNDKIAGLNLLVKNTFRYHMLKGLQKNNLHFKQCANLADKIKLAVITRPKNGYKLYELVNAIENDILSR